MMAIYCKNRTKYINTMCVQNTERSPLNLAVHVLTTRFQGVKQRLLSASGP